MRHRAPTSRPRRSRKNNLCASAPLRQNHPPRKAHASQSAIPTKAALRTLIMTPHHPPPRGGTSSTGNAALSALTAQPSPGAGAQYLVSLLHSECHLNGDVARLQPGAPSGDLRRTSRKPLTPQARCTGPGGHFRRGRCLPGGGCSSGKLAPRRASRRP